jgi:formylglycine-generating enzyme
VAVAACCVANREDKAPVAAPIAATSGAAGSALSNFVQIGACSFTMGNASADAVAADGEGPVRRVSLDAFLIAATTVTNFVRATRYVTDAERLGHSFVFYLQVPSERRVHLGQVAKHLLWWLPIADASWQRPEGPHSHIYERLNHPVVHVSWNDAQAYCAWADARLPTEAEWECAARGGLEGHRFPWGDDLAPNGVSRCHVWRGIFPNAPEAGWRPQTVAVADGETNGYGLFNVCGNVWEWCADWFSPAYHSETPAESPLFTGATGRRSMRGGSFLCHASYCNRYRVAARSSNTPHSSSSNLGFRLAR